MSIHKFAVALLNRRLIDNFHNEDVASRVTGAIKILQETDAFLYGGWKPRQGDWWKVKGKSGNTYVTYLNDCSCPDYHYRRGLINCAHIEAVKAALCAQRAAPHITALKDLGIEVTL